MYMKGIWEMKEKNGAKQKYTDPQELWDRAADYFEWCENNQIIEEKAFAAQGTIITHEYHHDRPFTQAGLCVHLGISSETWRNYRKDEKLAEVINLIDMIMFEQKFSKAAVGMFNANLISRDLNLADKSEIDHTTNGKDMNAKMSDEEFNKKLEDLGVKFD